MKELFGIDCTENKKNGDVDSVGFEAKRIGGDLEARIDAHNETAEELESSAELPPALGIIKWICALGFIAFASGLIRNIGKLSFAEMYRNAPWVFWVLVLFAAVFIVLTVLGRKRGKETAGSREYSDARADLDAINEECAKQLGVPEGARKIDLLVYRYKAKDGENKLKEEMYGHFIRCEGFIFRENGCFCMSDGMVRYDIPQGDIKDIEIIKKKFFMNDWGKEGSLKDYKEFVLENTDNLGRVWLRSVCVMHFTMKGEEFAFRFPAYELEAVESVSGVTANRG